MTKDEALKLALEALEKIAFAGMAAPPEMSEDGRTKWHAQEAFNFIGIAAWALDSVKEAQPDRIPDAGKTISVESEKREWTPEDMAYRPGGLAQPEQETDWEGIAADQALTIALMKSESFKPDWDEKAVLVKEMQRMAKELQDSFKMGYDAGVLETHLDQAKERNFCPRCGKRLMSALGPVNIHTCCPPSVPTGWDNGLCQDYDKKLGAWFSEKPNAKEELRVDMAYRPGGLSQSAINIEAKLKEKNDNSPH